MANNELDTVITNLGLVKSQTDETLPWPAMPIGAVLNGIAAEIDALVAAEQGAGDLASLTTAMGGLTATIRLKIPTIVAACQLVAIPH